MRLFGVMPGKGTMLFSSEAVATEVWKSKKLYFIFVDLGKTFEGVLLENERWS